MQYAVVLIPDEYSVNKICAITELIYKEDFSNHIFNTALKPHITLSVFNDINPDEIKDGLIIFLSLIHI